LTRQRRASTNDQLVAEIGNSHRPDRKGQDDPTSIPGGSCRNRPTLFDPLPDPRPKRDHVLQALLTSGILLLRSPSSQLRHLKVTVAGLRQVPVTG
jgi:hypothetical protein